MRVEQAGAGSIELQAVIGALDAVAADDLAKAKRCAQRSAKAATDPSALRKMTTASFRMVRPASCSRARSSAHIATYQALRTKAPVIIALLLRAGCAMPGFTFTSASAAAISSLAHEFITFSRAHHRGKPEVAWSLGFQLPC
jgi:hypothetical protein